MKTKLLTPCSLLLALSLLSSCETAATGPQVKGDAAAQVRNFVNVVEPGLRPAARAACALYLSYATSEKDRADLKANIFTVSSMVASVDPNVSPGDLSKQIQGALGDSSSENKTLADSIAGGWAISAAFVRGDPALLIKVTSDLAAGCADATK